MRRRQCRWPTVSRKSPGPPEIHRPRVADNWSTPSFHYSTVPAFQHSTIPAFPYSTIPSLSAVSGGSGEPVTRNKANLRIPRRAKQSQSQRLAGQGSQGRRAKQSQFAVVHRAKQTQFAWRRICVKLRAEKGLWYQMGPRPARKTKPICRIHCRFGRRGLRPARFGPGPRPTRTSDTVQDGWCCGDTRPGCMRRRGRAERPC